MPLDKPAMKHPAYGHAIFCRTTGKIKLFASPIPQHHEFITLTISHSELRHDLSRDWRFARDPIVEVAFSAAQFAQLLTTLNVGEGAPCTIQRMGHELVPRIPDDEKTESDRVKEGFEEGLHALRVQVGKAQRTVTNILAKKTLGKLDREIIREAVSRIRTQVESNWPFVLEQFQQAAAKVVTASQAEIEATVTGAVEKLGIKSLQDLTRVLGEGEPAFESRPKELEE